MSLVAWLKPKGPSGYGYGSTAEEVTRDCDLRGQRFLLTGANSGLGLETLRVLTTRGAHVIATGRSRERVEQACASLPGEQVSAIACDLGKPQSVRSCAATIKSTGEPLQGIICNAGVMALPRLEQLCGYERQFFTNHIGHFILVTELLECLADKARIVVVSSDAHRSAPKEGIQFDNLNGERGYRGWSAYGQSKLANLLFARALAPRLSRGIVANALHPGVIKTNLARHMNPVVGLGLAIARPIALKSIAQGAATQCYLAAHPAGQGVNGEYFSDCNVAQSSHPGQDLEMAARLWERSEAIVAGL